MATKRLEDMTPDERAFADAWAERQIARAYAKAQGIRGTCETVRQASERDEAPAEAKESRA